MQGLSWSHIIRLHAGLSVGGRATNEAQIMHAACIITNAHHSRLPFISLSISAYLSTHAMLRIRRI